MSGWQTDLFPLSSAVMATTPHSHAATDLKGLRSQPPGGVAGLAEMAEILERSGDYRVLRRLEPRAPVARALPLPEGTRIGVIVDTDTTGLDHAKDEVVELGMIAFTHDQSGILDVVDVFSALREPTVEIRGEITNDDRDHARDGGGTKDRSRRGRRLHRGR